MSGETLEEYKARIARSGGKARAAKLTKKQRSDSARKAVEARWAKFDNTLAETNAILDRVEKSAKKAKAKTKAAK